MVGSESRLTFHFHSRDVDYIFDQSSFCDGRSLICSDPPPRSLRARPPQEVEGGVAAIAKNLLQLLEPLKEELDLSPLETRIAAAVAQP